MSDRPTPSSTVTRGEQMLALRKRRMAGTHPFLRGGFRPFFLGAATWAIIAMVLWIFALTGSFEIPTAFDPVAWHRHEMLFGFVGAAVIGFLLTAIPNWTGSLPIAGPPLLVLFASWATARLAVLTSARTTIWAAAVLDVGLFAAVALLAAREVRASKNRNMPVVALVFAFGVADALDYAEAAGFASAGWGWRGAVALPIVMISVVGGRIIPSFTRNWMAKSGWKHSLPTQPQSVDLLVIASTVVALTFWIFFASDHLTGIMLILASAAQFLRLSRWGGHRTFADPLVFILHAGYFWVPAGLLLLGLAIGGMDVPETAGVHALTAGAMTTMILAVMTRASLGHTGRDLKASRVTGAGYICVTAGAVLRVASSLFSGAQTVVLVLAGAFWATAMLLFLTVYGPILWAPRAGEAA